MRVSQVDDALGQSRIIVHTNITNATTKANPSQNKQIINQCKSESILSVCYYYDLLQLMKYLFKQGSLPVLALVVCCVLATSSTNTTGFFADQTGFRLYYESFAGYEDVNWYYNSTASIYYSLWQAFGSTWADKTIPLIIWLQGGPGASSQFGCFNEVGPIAIEGGPGTFKATENVWAWNSFGHVMCVDQPVGSGFSYNNASQQVSTTREAANHFINFLYNFYRNNPKFNLAQNPLYLAGESYAGHFIPTIADLILTNSSLNFNLKGVILGGAWVDPISQSNNYESYLNSVGAVSNEFRDTMAFMQNEALIRIDRGDRAQATGYINFLLSRDDKDVAKNYYLGMNVFNYRQYGWSNINNDYKIYLQDKKKNFGVPDGVNYKETSPEIYKSFAADFTSSTKQALARILNPNNGLQVLIYNGQNDFVVNTPGVLTYLNSLEWQYLKEWKAKPKKIWSEYGSLNYGWYKKHRNLNFVMVRNAGHFTPADQPGAAWRMINRYFLNNW